MKSEKEEEVLKSIEDLNNKLSELYIKEDELERILENCKEKNITINLNVTNNYINSK